MTSSVIKVESINHRIKPLRLLIAVRGSRLTKPIYFSSTPENPLLAFNRPPRQRINVRTTNFSALLCLRSTINNFSLNLWTRLTRGMI